jgi:hypothetical protein
MAQKGTGMKLTDEMSLSAHVICFALPASYHLFRPTKKRKGRLVSETPFLIVCPADAVLAKLPFPSKQGWITVGALLTSNQGLSLNRAQPSLHGINHIGFGALARNPEHRRAKYVFLP